MERTKVSLDTHILLWMYTKKSNKIPPQIQNILKNSDLYISPMVVLELSYLSEVGKIQDTPSTVISAFTEQINLQVFKTPFDEVVDYAKDISWTRDAFDRIIVAHAIAEEMELVSADRNIRKNFEGCLWE